MHILATPGLTDSLRKEVSPHIQVSKPLSIGKIFEAPKLTISYDGLSKHCPLLKATYLEAMRLSSQPWSIRQLLPVLRSQRTGRTWAQFHIFFAKANISPPHMICTCEILSILGIPMISALNDS
jgi:hypothetical protein